MSRVEEAVSGSMLEAEIREQPAVVAARAAAGLHAAAEVAALTRGTDVSYWAIAARGSSDNAARFAQYLWGRHLGLATYLAAPSLYAEGRPPVMARAAVLGVSQSGQSPDIVRVLSIARDQGMPTIAITNDASSPLADQADVVVPLLAGRERSVAATKTYTATLHAVAQLAVALGAPDLADDLDRMPDLLEATVSDALVRSAPDLSGPSGSSLATPLTTVGRGTGFATAAETALKIREVAGIRAESYPVPDLLHGPVAANGVGSAAWVVCSPSYPPGYWSEVVSGLVASGVHVVAVHEAGQGEISAPASIELPAGLPAWLFDAAAVIHGQVAALRLGEARAVDVDRPVGLNKVTRTT
jgi:glutamine---fructose-6-phosphate transaminase (isomerizing)